MANIRTRHTTGSSEQTN